MSGCYKSPFGHNLRRKKYIEAKVQIFTDIILISKDHRVVAIGLLAPTANAENCLYQR
jgi:uncharacterized membrane protein (UPF0127 family)